MLLVVTAAAALFNLINAPYPQLAPLQNLPTFAILALLGLALRRWPMPTSAVTCIALFLMLHTLGGRYIYSNVPYDYWLSSLGLPAASDVLGLQRNSYDRLVHFSFGLLMVHPFATVLKRYVGVSPRMAVYVAVVSVFAASALYEVFEWQLTLVMAGADADAYNGQQGDMWDAQKDMACSGFGAVLTVLLKAIRQR